MKELEFLKVISQTLDNNTFLGDDTAYLEDLGIFVTQDTLVEDVKKGVGSVVDGIRNIGKE